MSFEAGAAPLRGIALPARARSAWFGASTIATIALGVVFFSGLHLMVQWWEREEYSHAWLIPPIAAYLVWQRRAHLRALSFTGSWWGVAAVAAGLLLWLLGELSSIYTIIQYGFLVCLAGAVLAFGGRGVFSVLSIPLLLLVFMIPLPSFIYFNLSQKLQLLSSEMGVWVIHRFGISVFLEGNVIDLGNYQLQVVEACSGLRYLFPLMTLGFISALFFRVVLWKRLLVFFSTIPITVLMNSFRIGVIGVLVDRYGTAQAEGFLHDFEGWVIFMACFALLFAEMWLIARLSGERRRLREILAPEASPAAQGPGAPSFRGPVPASAWTATVLLAAAVIPSLTLSERAEAVPARSDFAEFPMQLDSWKGQRGQIERIYLDELKLSDYLMADYARGARDGVNFYVAWYDSQRKGESVHSPKGCLPGGGWVIEKFGQTTLAGVGARGADLSVNRAVIAQGNNRQLVYYWFQQRGRVVTNEYLVKWYLFWDALTRNRSDGSLVRLITRVDPNDTNRRADVVLRDFVRASVPVLTHYVPD